MTEEIPPVTVFVLGPSFVTQDAARLHDSLSCAVVGARIEIDFRGVREWDAAALAMLARDLVDRGEAIHLRGLSHRQLRLLSYLGAVPQADKGTPPTQVS